IQDSLHGQKWLAYLVIGALGVVFAAWGVYGMVDMNLGGSSVYAAKVEGEKIPADVVRNAWMRQQAQFEQNFDGEIPAEFRKMLQEQVLESFVRSTLLTQRTDELGYRISNAQIA